jgi:periplasmic protein TonB
LFRDRRTPAFSVSLGLHLAISIALVLAARQSARAPSIAPDSMRRTTARVVWLNDPGPGGGGGGGGDHLKDPPRRAESPGHDAITVQASPPRASDFSRPATVEPDPVPQLIAPIAALASAIDALPKVGAIDAPPSPSTSSQGPGDGGGAGTGNGTGDGPGRGAGLGDGELGGTGGKFFRPGGDVSMPVEIQKGTPRYTTEAMRARIQGSITVQCVVETTGTCERIRVLRSFDPAFGLDQEAIKAAAQWRFRPGSRRGEPVPVMVTMEIAFALR